LIFVDTNIPMYLVGASRPHKLDAQRMLESALSAGERLVTDAEVLQEICHRYVAINRRDAIQPAFDAILQVVDDVLPVGRADVEHAKDTLLRYPALSARDALHVAIMVRRNVAQLMSFDRGFDSYPGIKRLT
jgi:uncharacterized protein